MAHDVAQPTPSVYSSHVSEARMMSKASGKASIGEKLYAKVQVDAKSPVLKKLAELEGKLHEDARSAPSIPFIKTPKADTFFGIVILLNAAFMGVDIELNDSSAADINWPFWMVESAFLVIFSVEIMLRLQAEYPQMCRFFDAWGTFDTFVTVMGVVDCWVFTFLSAENAMSSFSVLRMLRLFRLVRLVRVLRMFNELVVLVQTIGNSMRAVAWMSLLLGLIMYAGAVMTVMLLGIPYRESNADVSLHFGSLGSALFSHFCVVTLEAWPDIAMAAININRLWAFYFVFVIVLTNFTLLNLMIGVIVERIIHVSQEQENELASFVAESQQFRLTLQALFDTADMDASGTVTREEIRDLLDDVRTHEIMSAFGINLNIPKNTLHTIMDLTTDGETSFEEFYNACMRLCGSKHNVHSVFVQGDICAVQRELETRLTAIESSFQQYMERAEANQTLPSVRRSGTAVSSVPEGVVSELLERLDRVTHAQQYMFAEIHALKEVAALNRDRGPLVDPPLPNVGPMLLHKAGQEVAECCLDSLFSQRRVGGGPVAHRSRSAAGGPGTDPSVSGRSGGGDLRSMTRKSLEAEFHNKRAR